jgi:hypothetical protein
MKFPRKVQELPRPISLLWVIIVYGEKQVPSSILPVLDAIKKCVEANRKGTPLTTFDKEMRRIVKKSPVQIDDMMTWLEQPATQSMFSKAGGSNLPGLWLEGLQKIQLGYDATVAFTSPGRQNTWSFPQTHRDAFETERLRRSGMKLINAFKKVFGPYRTDYRDIRRLRAELEVKLKENVFLGL